MTAITGMTVIWRVHMNNNDRWQYRHEIGSIVQRIQSPKRLSVILKMCRSLEGIEVKEIEDRKRRYKREKGVYNGVAQ